MFVESETKFAVQKNWKTPSLFPCCPNSISENPISSYNLNLKTGLVFSKNYFSTSIIQDFAISENQQKLWVFCKTSETGTLKPWSLAEITFEDELFIHNNLGSFFTEDGAKKQLVLSQGLEWFGEDSIDDFC